MTHELVPSDVALLDLLRQESQLSIAQFARAMEVTATAVRQRLNRLMAQGFVERSTVKSGRGRPSHRYELTSSGRRRTGENFGDLAIALWQEVREIKDPEVRRGLIERLSKRLAKLYAGQIRGSTLEEKMQSLADIFSQRRIPFEVNQVNALPVLKAVIGPRGGQLQPGMSYYAGDGLNHASAPVDGFRAVLAKLLA